MRACACAAKRAYVCVRVCACAACEPCVPMSVSMLCLAPAPTLVPSHSAAPVVEAVAIYVGGGSATSLFLKTHAASRTLELLRGRYELVALSRSTRGHRK